MKTIALFPDFPGFRPPNFRAIAGKRQAVGKTAGEALDALVEQLDEEEAGILVIVQHLRPDAFFTVDQQQRLQELMARWHCAQATQSSLSPDERAELDSLVEAEWRATAERTRSLVRGLAP
jgi:hypothetical protein